METNKIVLGDAYKLIKEVPDKSVDLVVTDPPYLMDSRGGGGCFGNRERPYQDDIDKLADGVSDEMLTELDRVMKRTNIYIFCNKNQLRQYLNFYATKNVDLLVWHKTNPVPRCNNKYLSDLEYVVFARDVGVPLDLDYGRASKLYETPANKSDKDLFLHPTIKPLDFVSRLVRNSGGRNHNLVFDPFCGSGTTLVAAKTLGFDYLGFEIDEDFYKIACDRLNGIDQKGQGHLFDI